MIFEFKNMIWEDRNLGHLVLRFFKFFIQNSSNEKQLQILMVEKFKMRVQNKFGPIFYHFFLQLSGPDIFMSSHVSFQSYHINACFILPRGAKITPRGQEKKMTISPVMIGYF